MTNLKNAWEKEKSTIKPLKVQAIHLPVIKKREPPQMRNRIHREPTNEENVVRPNAAGVKEVPDYVVNLLGRSLKSLSLRDLGYFVSKTPSGYFSSFFLSKYFPYYSALWSGRVIFVLFEGVHIFHQTKKIIYKPAFENAVSGRTASMYLTVL